MKIEQLSVQEALEKRCSLPFAYVSTLSDLYLGKNNLQFSMEELEEARFFSEIEEIRFFKQGEDWKAARCMHEDGDLEIVNTYPIANPRFGKNIIVCRCLEADEDGQSYVCAFRLAGWEEGNEHE